MKTETRPLRLSDPAARAFPRLFGEAVLAARKARRMSQLALANELGIDQSRVSQIEQGQGLPIITTAFRLSHSLGLDIEAIWRKALSATEAP